MITHKRVYLVIASIGLFDQAMLYPKDPMLVGKNFDLVLGYY